MSTRLQSRLWTELTAAKKFLKMAEIKHQVLIFDQQLCLDSTFGKMILNSLKSCAVIANHFGSLNQTLSSSLSIGVVDIKLEEVTQETNEDGGHLGLEHNIEIRPLISPPIFLSSSTLLEVFAAIDVMMKPKEKVAQKIKGNDSLQFIHSKQTRQNPRFQKQNQNNHGNNKKNMYGAQKHKTVNRVASIIIVIIQMTIRIH